MRTLQDYFLQGGQHASIETPTNISTDSQPVDDRGYVRAVAVHVNVGTMDTITTFKIKINGVDTGRLITLPVTAINNGLVLEVDGDTARVEPGDRVNLETNGEGGSTPAILITYIIRR